MVPTQPRGWQPAVAVQPVFTVRPVFSVQPVFAVRPVFTVGSVFPVSPVVMVSRSTTGVARPHWPGARSARWAGG
jgi:hypothetical protein